jgi:hypothetical protein
VLGQPIRFLSHTNHLSFAPPPPICLFKPQRLWKHNTQCAAATGRADGCNAEHTPHHTPNTSRQSKWILLQRDCIRSQSSYLFLSLPFSFCLNLSLFSLCLTSSVSLPISISFYFSG